MRNDTNISLVHQDVTSSSSSPLACVPAYSLVTNSLKFSLSSTPTSISISTSISPLIASQGWFLLLADKKILNNTTQIPILLSTLHLKIKNMLILLNWWGKNIFSPYCPCLVCLLFFSIAKYLQIYKSTRSVLVNVIHLIINAISSTSKCNQFNFRKTLLCNCLGSPLTQKSSTSSKGHSNYFSRYSLIKQAHLETYY